MIHVDFSIIQADDSESLKRQIKNFLLEIANKYEVKISPSCEYSEVLNSLINQLVVKEKVVVLIDEYDCILTNNINNENIEDIRNVLRGFYSVLEAQSANIRMCFITGVTKFSKMSIFSSMNNLTDISMNEEYATMLGYTQQELEDNFAEHIERSVCKRQTTREEFLADIKYWYDGYCFAPGAESVYNPVSVGSFFSAGGKTFANYWISTGGMPYILTEVAKRVHFDISFDTQIEVPASILGGVDLIQMVKTEVNKDNFLALLYQSGYLTIKKAELIGGCYLITLNYPNREVKEGLNEILLPLYLGTSAGNFKGLRVLKQFYNGNVDAAMSSLSSIYASIPYNELVFNAENAWHASFLSMLTLMGADIIAEEPTNVGRIDAVITCPRYIYIVEFKYNQTAEQAIEQIRKKKYWEKYLNMGKEIHLLGINFSTEQKNIAQWKDEVL